MKIIIALLVGLLILLQLEVWRQFQQIGQLELQFEQQVERNTQLRERNNALAAEVEDLKSGLEAVEERARSELGLVREGERFYLVVDPDDLPEGQSEAVRALEALPVEPPLEEPPDEREGALEAPPPARDGNG